jgi:CheY-like chemotaxis protein
VSKILVIDDDGTVRAVLGALLGKFGHQAILASNPLDGIAAAESGSIDVVLIDMNMPGLDGLEAVKAIARPRTAHSDHRHVGRLGHDERRGLCGARGQLGAALFLPKPFDGTDLQGAITAVCREL